ncbi:lysylphosphatidylglycerol synthase domain-containing protein [Paenibacillus albus]|uniref:Phosphatidylglycerol lysyltransferase n=1 Tax=Paenibacillus albus TaxID=2495582 RepID=A0A3Q8X4I7_9BACL|nr:lysylphosphatidylglycerol synthase domain-containing protein [Paenibacillus albus]AZN39059.1 hypothetical protein EJC50_04785 [Paenibacillus albus]
MAVLRRLTPAVLKAVFLAVIVFFIVRNIPLKLSDITSFLLKANVEFYASLALFALFLMLQAGIWVMIVNAVGKEGRRSGEGSGLLRLLPGLQIFINSQFAKYIPGGFWNYAGRIVLASRAGVPLNVQFSAIIYENVLLVSAALIYALMLAVTLGTPLQLVLLGVVVGGALIYFYYPRVAAWTGRMFERASKWKLLQRAIARFSGPFGDNRLSEAKAVLTRNQFFGYLACFLGSHFIMGIAFWMLTSSFSGERIGLFYAAGTFATSWLLGLFSPLPGGLGVREGFLVYFLSLKLGADVALHISVIARLWNIMAEVAFWAVIQSLTYLKRKVKVYEA